MATTDNLYLPILFFGLMVTLLVLALTWSVFYDTAAIWSQPEYGQTIRDRGESFITGLDFFMVCLYIGLHLSVIALGYLLRSHPVMLMGGIAFIVLLTLITPVISNAYVDVVASDVVFSGVINDYPMANFIMEQLPLIEFIFAIITAVFTFGFAVMAAPVEDDA